MYEYHRIAIAVKNPYEVPQKLALPPFFFGACGLTVIELSKLKNHFSTFKNHETVFNNSVQTGP